MRLSELRLGAVIGKWTLLERRPNVGRGNRVYWCRCECGTERAVVGLRLARGDSMSCGCVRHGPQLARRRGEKINRWTVGEKLPCVAGQRTTRYQCTCQCGTPRVLTGAELRTNKPMSCGCASTRTAIAFTAGQRVGRWTVIGKSEIHSPQGRLLWSVRCDCGEERDIAGTGLRGGYSKGCGCQRNARWATRRGHGLRVVRKTPCNTITIQLERSGNVFRADCKTLWCDGTGRTAAEALAELAIDLESTIATIKLGTDNRRLNVVARAMVA